MNNMVDDWAYMWENPNPPADEEVVWRLGVSKIAYVARIDNIVLVAMIPLHGSMSSWSISEDACVYDRGRADTLEQTQHDAIAAAENLSST